jgi:hypothetical protein
MPASRYLMPAGERGLAKSLFRLVLVLTALMLALSCDQDVFQLSSRKLAGDYFLHRWEDGNTYYLEDRTRDTRIGGGVIGGVVAQVGWSDAIILVKRRSTFAGDPDGWMIVDVRKKTVSGPYPPEQVGAIANAKGIHVVEAKDAWAKL